MDDVIRSLGLNPNDPPGQLLRALEEKREKVKGNLLEQVQMAIISVNAKRNAELGAYLISDEGREQEQAGQRMQTAQEKEAQQLLNKAHALLFAQDESARDPQQGEALLRQAAELGSRKAQYYYGVFLKDGRGIPQDGLKAAHWLHRAADAGELRALDELGTLYEGKHGLPRDMDKAIACYAKVAAELPARAGELTDPRYTVRALVKYYYFELEPPDYETAVNYMRLGEELGDNWCRTMLGFACRDGTGVAQEPETAVEWFRASANEGDESGMSALGDAYRDGEGVPQHPGRAIEWYEKASAKGDGHASMQLALYYLQGEHVEQNVGLAMDCFALAAEQGEPGGLYQMALRYQAGDGVPQNYARAIELYEKSIEEGITDAGFHMGNIYYLGWLGEKYFDKACEAWKIAAGGGHARAASLVANCYAEGEGVPQDGAEAVKWYRKAAELGHALSWNILFDIYRLGTGVAQDYREALDCLIKGADAGYDDSQYQLGVFLLDDDGMFKKQNKADRYAEAYIYLHRAMKQGHPAAHYELGTMFEYGLHAQQDIEHAAYFYNEAMELGDDRGRQALVRLRRL